MKDQLNQTIRQKLQEQEKIGQDEIHIKTQQKINANEADFRQAETFQPGDILQVRKKEFSKRIKLTREKIEEVRVLDTNCEKNEIKLQVITNTSKYEIYAYASELAKYVKQIERQQEKNFAVGDKIITLQNDKKTNVKNGEIFVVKEIWGDEMVLVAENTRKEVKINLKQYNWIDHAYCVTNFKAQGMTVRNVLYFCDQSNMNYNAFYVAVTRGKENCKIYTTNAIQMLYNAQFEQEKKSISSLQQRKENTSVLSRSEIAEMYIHNLFEKFEKGKISLEELKRKFWNSIKYIDSFSKQKEFRKKLREVLEQQEEKLQKQEQIQVQQQKQTQQQEKQQEQVKIKMIKKQAKNFILER